MAETRKEKMLGVIQRRQPNLTVILENVFDPHNISAVMRTCDSVGIGQIHTLYTEAPPHNLVGFRSSAGAWKWVEKIEYSSLGDCVDKIKAGFGAIYAAHLDESAKSIYDTDFTKPMAIVFGNEQKGCSGEILKHCDGQVFIPQVGMVQSLNISVACGVILYEAFRQKMAAGHYAKPGLPLGEMDRIFEGWTDFRKVREKKNRKP